MADDLCTVYPRIMELPAEDFHHPYSPYGIQLQFMRALYTCLEEGKVAIFESPTGKLKYGDTIFIF